MTRAIRAFVLNGPREYSVEDVLAPSLVPGEAIVDVARVGLCGTDVAFFTGEMTYLKEGHSRYPMRLGHEWAGVVSAVGEGVDPRWIGRRVTGDTMLGDGVCRRCQRGHQHVCANREEVGVRGGRPGALAEQLSVPVTSLHELPDSVDDTVGALVEPGANSLRAAHAAGVRDGDRALVLGPGTIGLLTAMFLRETGAEVHLMGRTPHELDFARSLGFANVWTEENLPELPFDAVIDASNAPHLPARALDLVEPSGRVVYIGLASAPSVVDTRALVFKDVTAIGVLSGSPTLKDTIQSFAEGKVDPRPLVAATLSLDHAGAILAGERPGGVGSGPKFHFDPRI